MGSGDQATQQNKIDTGRDQANKAFDQFSGQLPNTGDTYKSGNQERSGLLGQYQSYAQGGGMTQQNANALTGIYGGPQYKTNNQSSQFNGPVNNSNMQYTMGGMSKGGAIQNADTGENYGSYGGFSSYGQPVNNNSGGGNSSDLQKQVLANPNDNGALKAWIQAKGVESGFPVADKDAQDYVNSIRKNGAIDSGTFDYYGGRIANNGGFAGGGGGGFGGGSGMLGPSAFESLGPSAFGNVDLNGSSAHSGYQFSKDPSAYKDVSLPDKSNINVDVPNKSYFDDFKSSIGNTGLGESELRNTKLNDRSAYNDVKSPNFDEARAGYNDISKTGGVDSDKINQNIDKFDAFTGDTGGFNNDRLGNINSVSDRLRNRDTSSSSSNGLDEIGRTGGYNPEDVDNIARGTLKDFEKTGGYSVGDIQNIRSRAAAASPAFYENVKNELDRGRRSTGNSAGASATDFKLLRQGSQDASRDRLDAEVGMQREINDQKFRASNSLAGYYGNITANKTANRLGALTSEGNLDIGRSAEERAGLSAAGSLDLDTQNSINSSRMGGMNSQVGARISSEGMKQQGRLGGLAGLSDVGTRESNADLSKAGGLDTFAGNLNDANIRKGSASDNYNLGRAGINLDQQKAADASGLAQRSGQDAFGFNKGGLQLSTGQAKDATDINQAGLRLQRAGGLDSYTNSRDSMGLQQDMNNANLDNSMRMSMNSNRLQQAGGLDNYALSRAGGLDAHDVAGGQLGLGYANMNQNYGLAQQAGQQNAMQFLQGQEQSGRQAGMNGLLGLYGTSYGPSSSASGINLDALKAKYGTDLGYLNSSGANQDNRSWWDKYGGIITGGLGSFGGFGGGGNSSSSGGNLNANDAYMNSIYNQYLSPERAKADKERNA